MKLSEWNDLCEREWTERCGDVIGLSLTGPSATELVADVFASPEAAGAKMPPGACGARVDSATNLVTGSPVTVTHGALSDTATVRYGTGELARTVAIGIA